LIALIYFLSLLEGSFLMNQGLWQVINFIVFVAIMIYILRNKIGIGKVFDDRAV
jgi:F0F1-type ATP synthase membrane subunit b/b'